MPLCMDDQLAGPLVGPAYAIPAGQPRLFRGMRSGFVTLHYHIESPSQAWVLRHLAQEDAADGCQEG